MRLAKPRGLLFIIGGGEDKGGDCTILTEFVRLAGAGKARVIVMTAATDEPEELGAEYVNRLIRLEGQLANNGEGGNGRETV